jgi:hypothetical protein
VKQRDPFWTIIEHRGIRINRAAERMRYSAQYLYDVQAERVPLTTEFRRRAAEYLDLPESVLFSAVGEEVPA